MSRTTALAALLLVPSLALAGKVKTYTASAPAHFDKAQIQNAVVTSDGTVRLARAVKPLPGTLDATRVWDVAEDKAGNLYVATGDDGKIFKITPDGKTSVAFTSEDSQILCLTAAADGTVFAGTGPNGTIIRIDLSGNAAVFATSTEKYIWSLVYDEKAKSLYAATGPRGKLLAVDSQGKASVFFQAKQDHILSLARADDGTLYAGTDKQGLIYRIDAKGKGFVLFQAPQAEVRCLYLTANALYAGTSAASASRSGGSASRSGGSGGTPSSSTSAIPNLGSDASRVAEDGKTKAASTASREKTGDGDKGGSASAASAPTPGENSVYRIGFDGSVRELFREKGLVLSLYPHAGRLFVGTGLKGQLFEINESTKERSEVSRLDHGQVQRLFARRDGSLIVAASDPARLYTLADRFAPKGTVVSEVIDAKLASKWGALSWQADLPKGTAVAVAVRAGNVAEPDDTWTDWSAELTDPKESAAPVPAARYLQYRVTLSADDTGVSPALHGLTVRYATLNQAPEVTALDVPSADAVRESKKLRVKWSATDANEDELAFDVYVRKEGWKDWVRIEEGLSKNDYEWDTTTMPSGVYRIKVVASDRPDNNEEAALTGERVSLPVAVAHEPPAVAVTMTGVEGGRATFEASATADLVRLASATYAVNSGKWVSVFPTDGVFDAKAEKFKFQSEPLRPGSYVLVLKVRDAAGNTGSADVVFEVK